MSVIIVLCATGLVAGCGKTANEPMPAQALAASSLNASITTLAEASDMQITDLSIPFEQFTEAPARLRQIAELLSQTQPGFYVLNYYDDTLRQTRYAFVVTDNKSLFVRFTSLPGDSVERFETIILTAQFEEATRTLVLQTGSGEIRLTAADVTPAGA